MAADAVGPGPLLKPNVLWAQRSEMVLLRVKMEPLQVSTIVFFLPPNLLSLVFL